LLNPSLNGGNGVYAANDAQYASLRNLENQAVGNTLHDHRLPQSDATAAQTWGREDALAELWLLFVEAIMAPPCTATQTPGKGCRTTDQQNAVDWLTSVAQRDAVQAAQAAGLEYVKWAGLDHTAYQDLLASRPGHDAIKRFLCGGSASCPVTPLTYAPAGGVTTCPSTGACVSYNGSNYTAGFCVYQPPSPFQSEYSDVDNILCSSRCPEAAICTPLGPKYDQFVKWGAADVNNKLFDTPGSAQELNNVAIGVGFGVGTAAAITALSLGTTLTTAVGGGGALGAASTALFPFAASIGVTIAGAASLALIAVAGAIAIGFYSVELFDAAAVPDQLATLMVNASTKDPDLRSMVNDSSAMGGLFALFIGAAQPKPYTATCFTIDATGTGCLNPPAIPAASSQTDPQFKVNPVSGEPIYANSVTWYDAVKKTTTTARLSGNWFVEHVTDANGNVTDEQSLRIHYTDWGGSGHTAWLLNLPKVGYQFIGLADQSSTGTPLNLSTCLADNTCAYTSTIDYVGTDGKYYRTSVDSPLPTQPLISFPLGNVVEGDSVNFNAEASSPVGLPLTYSWEIEDKPINPPIKVCFDAQLNQIQCAPPSVSLSGDRVTFAFPTSGTFSVVATATDSALRSSSSTIAVNVADSPPRLAVYPECAPLLSCLHANVFSAPVGTATSLGGDLVHVGSEDVESLEINWGDDSPNDSASNRGASDPHLVFYTSNQYTNSGKIYLPFLATHQYRTPGSYTVTLSATDQSSTTTTATATENVVTSVMATPTSTATPTATASPTPSPTVTATPAVAKASPTATTTTSTTVSASPTSTATPPSASVPTATAGQTPPTSSPAPASTATPARGQTSAPTGTPVPAATNTSTPSAPSSGRGGNRSGGGAGPDTGAGAATAGGGAAPAPAPAPADERPAEMPPDANAGVPAAPPVDAGVPAAPPVEVAGVTVSESAYSALGIGLIGAEGLVPGQQAVLTLLLVNASSVDASPNLIVQDTLPASLTFSNVVTDDWACASVDGQVVTCTPTNTLSGGAQTQLQLAVEVAADATGLLTNTAIVSGDSLDPAAPLPTSVDTVQIMDPSLDE